MSSRVEVRPVYEFGKQVEVKELREAEPTAEVLGDISEVFQPKRMSKDTVAPRYY